MTFDEFFEQTTGTIKLTAETRKWLREAYANVWNAAIDAVRDEIFRGERHPAVLIQDARKAVVDYYSVFPIHLGNHFRDLSNRAHNLDAHAGNLKVYDHLICPTFSDRPKTQ